MVQTAIKCWHFVLPGHKMCGYVQHKLFSLLSFSFFLVHSTAVQDMTATLLAEPLRGVEHSQGSDLQKNDNVGCCRTLIICCILLRGNENGSFPLCKSMQMLLFNPKKETFKIVLFLFFSSFFGSYKYFSITTFSK